MSSGNAKQPQNEIAAYETAQVSSRQERYHFRLYVTGTTSISSRAVVNVRKFCEAHLPGQYELEVVDILQNPSLAAAAQIVAAPTLEKCLPTPVRRFVGEMSRTERMLEALGFPNGRREERHE